MAARLPGAPSLAARGMLGQAGAWGALNHERLWGRAGGQAVPRGRKGWSCLRSPSPCTPPDPQNLSPPCHTFIFTPTLTTV